MSCARKNQSSFATVSTDEVFATGGFKIVYRGVYKNGPRKGQDCVCKVFKTGAVYEKSFFDHEMNVVNRAMLLIEKFNAANLINKKIYLNQPAIWEFTQDSGYAGQKNLIEPMIEDFEKFNSNSGWVADDDTPWNLVMQALSHFSYHVSGGFFLLCDLQGGIYRDGVVLTDPVIMSRRKEYGPTDLGPEGISTFFARHECNQYCRSEWTSPRNRDVYFDYRKGTSMIHVPTRPSRAAMSKQSYY